MRKTKLILTLVSLFILAFYGYSQLGFIPGQPCRGMSEFTDPRDGQTYRTVQIGDQCWMKENLKWLPRVSHPSTDSNTSSHYYVSGYERTSVSAAKATANYHTYGVLYNWPAALNACPHGWRLPSDTDWGELIDHLGGRGVAGGKMETTGTAHWRSPNTGATNESGFSALPGGYRGPSGSFGNIGNAGLWWSSTEFSSTHAWGWNMGSRLSGHVNRFNYCKRVGLSIRCVRNTE